jgi:hypothetical protein
MESRDLREAVIAVLLPLFLMSSEDLFSFMMP